MARPVDREELLKGPIQDIVRLGRQLAELDDRFKAITSDFHENNAKLAAVYKAMDEVMKKGVIDQDALRTGFEARIESVVSPYRVKLSTVVADLANHRGFVVTALQKLQDGVDTFHSVQDQLIDDLEELREVVRYIKEAYKPVPAPAPEVKPDVPSSHTNAWVAWFTLILLVLVGVGFALWHRPGL